MEEDSTSFVVACNAILDVGIEIADANFIVEDDPPLEASGVEKGKSSSSLYPKPLKAPRSKRKKEIDAYSSSLFFFTDVIHRHGRIPLTLLCKKIFRNRWNDSITFIFCLHHLCMWRVYIAC